MKDKLKMDENKLYQQVKQDKKIDKELRDGKKMESIKDPVDTVTAMQEGEENY